MLNLAGTKDARKMISKPRSVLTLTFILFLVMPAPSATERQEGSIGSMVAAEARERFSLEKQSGSRSQCTEDRAVGPR